jgi:hypothetical protein
MPDLISKEENKLQVNTSWDAIDYNYLATRFSINFLREEIDHSEHRENRYSGCIDFNLKETLFEREFREACRQAIILIRSRKPKCISQEISGYESADSIKSRYYLADYIGQFTKLKKSGSRYYGFCPLHTDKKSPSLVIYPNQSFYCFGCQAHGSIIDFVMALENLTFQDALARLSNGA